MALIILYDSGCDGFRALPPLSTNGCGCVKRHLNPIEAFVRSCQRRQTKPRVREALPELSRDTSGRKGSFQRTRTSKQRHCCQTLIRHHGTNNGISNGTEQVLSIYLRRICRAVRIYICHVKPVACQANNEKSRSQVWRVIASIRKKPTQATKHARNSIHLRRLLNYPNRKRSQWGDQSSISYATPKLTITSRAPRPSTLI